MKCVNACFRSDDPRGKVLSNFWPHPFVLDGVHCGTVEALIQGIKFPPGDPRRESVFAATKGVDAWRMRGEAENKYVWWGGERYRYRSLEHQGLIERAIRARLEQNPDAMIALLDTAGEEIIHEPGGEESPLTSLPAVEYCRILTTIREEVLEASQK